jgi:hypothetical protein
MLVTLGFMIPSAVAYLKVGGRVNSLLPLTLGSAVVLFRLLGALAQGRPGVAGLAAAIAVWGTLTVAPSTEAVPADLRASLESVHDRAVDFVRAETSAGRRTLLYGETAVWIDAGRRDVPLDRMQTVSELVLGGHPEAEAHFARLMSGAYDSILIRDNLVAPGSSSYSARLRSILQQHYTESLVAESPGVPPLRVYRFKG